MLAPADSAFSSNGFGQIFGKDQIGGAQHHGALDGVFELAHVAWPIVVRSGRRAPAARLPATARLDPLRELGGEIAGQQRDVFAALAQGGHAERNHVQPVEQILAEARRS